MKGEHLLDKILQFEKINKTEEALNQIRKLLEIEPDNIIALYIKNIIDEKQGNIPDFSDIFEKAKHLENKEILLNIIGQIDKALEVYPFEINGLTIRSLLLVQQHKVSDNKDFLIDLESHIKLLENAIEYHDRITDYDLVYKFMWHKMSSKNERDLGSCLNNSTTISSTATFEQLGIYNQLAACFELLLEYETVGTSILNNMGIIYSKNLYEEKAVEFFDKALEKNPNYICALNNKGVSNSVEFFDEVLKLDKLNFASCFNKSFFIWHSIWSGGDWKRSPDDNTNLEEALNYCEKALKIAPDDKQCWYLLGNIQQSQGKKDLAIKSYYKALEFAPNYVKVLHTQGELLFELDRLEEALNSFDKAIELAPRDMYLWDYKVEIYKKLKNEQEEFNCYQRMLEESPGYTYALLGKGRLFVDQGKYEEAVDSLNMVLKSEYWDDFWPMAIFHKARAAALKSHENDTFDLIKDAIRAGAALSEYRMDLDLKELFDDTPEFGKYKSNEVFKSILSYDYNTKEEKDKFWDDLKNS